MSKDVLLEAARILEKQIARHDRKPFRKELARFLGIAPTDKALEEWACKYPDKWAQAITMLAQLAGFKPGVEVKVSGVDPSEMSDVALLSEVRRLSVEVAARARGAAGAVVDIQVIEPSPPGELVKLPGEGEQAAQRIEQSVPEAPPTGEAIPIGEGKEGK